MNICIHSGRLTKAPALTAHNGIAKISFTLACRRDFKNKQGEYDTDFIFFQAYRRNAEYIAKYLKQGDFIEVTSCMRCVNYDKDGERQIFRFLECKDVHFISHPQARVGDNFDNLPQEKEIEFNFEDTASDE